MKMFVPPQPELQRRFAATRHQLYGASLIGATSGLLIAISAWIFGWNAWWWVAVPISAVVVPSLLEFTRPPVLWCRRANF